MSARKFERKTKRTASSVVPTHQATFQRSFAVGRAVTNKSGMIDPMKADPTRTAGLRRSFMAAMTARLTILRKRILALVEGEDVFGLSRQRQVSNIFCPTGPGGGVDPSCKKGAAKFTDRALHKPAKGAIKGLLKDWESADYDIVWPGGTNWQLTEKIVNQIAGAMRSWGIEPKRFKALPAIAGARPGDNIYFTYYPGNPGSSIMPNPGVHIHVRGNGYELNRTLTTDKDGKLVLHNDSFFADKKARGGLGSSIFLSQVKNASSLGVSRIETLAAKEGSGKRRTMNGYYTWPRLGYDHVFVKQRPYTRSESILFKMFPDAKSVQDIMKTKEGRDAWKKHGWSIEARFDLTPGSQSMKILGAYHAERKKRKAAETTNLAANAIPEDDREDWDADGIPLSPEDEEALDAAWDGMDNGVYYPPLPPADSDNAIDAAVLNERWSFRTTPEQLEEFENWLREQYADVVLDANNPDAYFQEFIRRGYEQGAGRAFVDARPVAGGNPAFYAGTRDQFLRTAFAQPIAKEKVKLLTSRVLTELRGVSQGMATRMMRTLADGLVRGESPRDVARRLTTVLDGDVYRAHTIARTETIRAHAEGQLDALELMGVTEVGVAVEWSTAKMRVCPLCQELNGVVLSIQESRGMIPRHPNAVFAGSSFASYGECEELVRAWYDGPAIVLTLGSGVDRTTIGPNHPVMTRRGMVKAAELREGDEVLHDFRGNRSAIGVDLKQVPMIEDVFQATVRILGDSAIVPSTSDLHGDSVFCQGEIEAVRPTLGLLPILDSFCIEKFRENGFARADADLSLLARRGPSFLSGHGIDVAPSGDVGIGRERFPIGFGHLAHPQQHAFSPRSRLSAGLQESADDYAATDAKMSRDCENALSGVEHLDEFLDRNGLAIFRWVKVQHVEVSTYKGWAFDATTATGIYCSDSLVVSNCRCAWIPANVGETDPNQIRTKRGIEQAIHESIRRELPASKQDDARALKARMKDTPWTGADTSVSESRPKSILDD